MVPTDKNNTLIDRDNTEVAREVGFYATLTIKPEA